ncbi:hypothetical protein PspLS_10733 [Pyricularia sp. CBS 133598]|nr:hypothetical protein PspLS_10733 [Pyricularia sp. CBS 133598]
MDRRRRAHLSRWPPSVADADAEDADAMDQCGHDDDNYQPAQEFSLPSRTRPSKRAWGQVYDAKTQPASSTYPQRTTAPPQRAIDHRTPDRGSSISPQESDICKIRQACGARSLMDTDVAQDQDLKSLEAKIAQRSGALLIRCLRICPNATMFHQPIVGSSVAGSDICYDLQLH